MLVRKVEYFIKFQAVFIIFFEIKVDERGKIILYLFKLVGLFFNLNKEKAGKERQWI